LTEPPTTLRFAVATFDTGNGLREALQNLRLEGLGNGAFNCLGLDEILTDAMVPPLSPGEVRQELCFPGNIRPIGCTVGVLAEHLSERLHAGAPTLQAALGHWLIPRHAAQIQDAVEQGMIVLWVRLFAGGDESIAYRSLLAGSSHSVGVHDLVAD
jgi:hypothetical protein